MRGCGESPRPAERARSVSLANCLNSLRFHNSPTRGRHGVRVALDLLPGAGRTARDTSDLNNETLGVSRKKGQGDG